MFDSASVLLLLRTIMAFELERFVKFRPFLYHLTSTQNLERICSSKRLFSAKETMTAANQLSHLRRRRKESVDISWGTHRVELQNQTPLHEGKIIFGGTFQFEDLIERLNSLVFFWPGAVNGPIRSGRSHFESKLWKPSAIRVQTRDLIAMNLEITPLFCPFNSGAPNYAYGKPSPRGLDTFLPANLFARGVSDVTEVVFPGQVCMPAEVEYANSLDGIWRPFSR
jgi:hypothetical protein